MELGDELVLVGGGQSGFTGAANAETTDALLGRINVKGKTLEIK